MSRFDEVIAAAFMRVLLWRELYWFLITPIGITTKCLLFAYFATVEGRVITLNVGIVVISMMKNTIKRQ